MVGTTSISISVAVSYPFRWAYIPNLYWWRPVSYPVAPFLYTCMFCLSILCMNLRLLRNSQLIQDIYLQNYDYSPWSNSTVSSFLNFSFYLVFFCHVGWAILYSLKYWNKMTTCFWLLNHYCLLILVSWDQFAVNWKICLELDDVSEFQWFSY